MPFKSEAQRKYLYANKPKVAKEFARKTPKIEYLPPRKAGKKTKMRMLFNKAKRLIGSEKTKIKVRQQARAKKIEKFKTS